MHTKPATQLPTGQAPFTTTDDLATLLADPATPARLLCDALYDDGWRRLRAARGFPWALTRAEWACLDALAFRAQVLNGGFQQWVENGCHERALQTVEALEAIGAPRAARLLRQALAALPDDVQQAIARGATGMALPDVRFGPKRTAYFARLSATYRAVECHEDLDALVAAYARVATA
jgi:hypothetical protein